MKACKKWWQNIGVEQRRLKFKSGMEMDKAYRSGIEDGWKAALEWFREEFSYAITDEQYWIVACIDEELNDNSNSEETG